MGRGTRRNSIAQHHSGGAAPRNHSFLISDEEAGEEQFGHDEKDNTANSGSKIRGGFGSGKKGGPTGAVETKWAASSETATWNRRRIGIE